MPSKAVIRCRKLILQNGIKSMMNLLRVAALGGAALTVGACSTITQGTNQEIYINTTPQNASCVLERNGQQISEISSTPGPVTVSKTKHDIIITCQKDGYQTASFHNNSGWEAGSGAAGIALDVILTLGASSAIDSMTGADNKYQPSVNILMLPVETTKPVEEAKKPASK